MRKEFLYRLIYLLFLGLSIGFLPLCRVSAAPRLQDVGDKIVIVIDPGHGGTNLGTTENGHEEKYMTMTTALAMYEELSLYEGIEVYLTRTEDLDISLKDRAVFAESVEADFLFSIHYNASENHELFGSEVWVSTMQPYNGYGYQFGCEFLSDMKEWGLLVRGVKTRIGNKGDYYGIIRESVTLGIPAVIIEHCHVDEDHDAVYCASEEQLQAFGRADAEAVARYFGLKSNILGVDYSGYELAEAGAENVKVTLVDETEPDFCQIAFLEADYEGGTLTVNVSAADYDSTLLYYSYSLDGGKTFSGREAWPECNTLTGEYADSFPLKLSIQPGTVPEVIVRAYNLYDLYAESNCYVSEQAFPLPPEPEAAVSEPPVVNVAKDEEAVPVDGNSTEENVISLYTFTLFCLAAVLAMLIAVILVQYVSLQRRRRRRLQRRKEAGNIWDQHR